MRARILTLVVLLLLAGCSSVPSLLYKIDIQQGNVITQEMVEKLKPGMTRSQVRFALGSPMISDAFHENRWDYVYRVDEKGQLVEQRNLTVFFEDDKLARIDGTFKSPLAFTQTQTQTQTQPAGSTDEAAPAGPLVREQGGGPVADDARVSDAIPSPADVPAPGDAAASGGAPVLSSIPDASAAPAASDTSGLPAPDKASPMSPRQVPSQATDTGNRGADQLKE
ncbi:outer membrane protein assembly factor BamE [Nitrosovibrio sp. Nv6]|uniref:outer membrane protein assembly factor BamE n=1 Tax=Nitrosovibrio sp. Nv6 TaxID=1855340 RepID=UPI0008CFDCA3|nr:outer membrane protein assembly factor BamE [Nitrosovibrio sp. Nv6]SEP04363.1 outer membrane protein assembly factor BamE [Nitrosovibrio sp. Nv6]